MVETHRVFWRVSLSNGETFHENKRPFRRIAGELSPWERLKIHMEREGAHITSLSLYANDGKTWNMPSAGGNPHFAAFASAPKPDAFNFFRRAGQSFNVDLALTQQHVFAVAEATIGTGKVQVWVNDKHPENCWVLVVPDG